MRNPLTPYDRRARRSARRNRSLLYSSLFSSCLLLAGAALGPAARAQGPEASAPLSLSHIAPAQASAKLLGRADSARTLSLTLVLPLRNRAALEDRLRRVADPKDALCGHYLTPEEFDAEFGPDPSDMAAVAAFAAAHGLTVRDAAGSTLVHVSGPLSAVESAFGVKINDYVGTDGRTFFGPDREPTVPTALAGRLLSVLGLSNASQAHPFSRRSATTPLLDYYTGNAGLSPADVKSIYSLTGSAYTGKGQLAAVFEDGTYTPSDITQYFSTYGISIPVKPVSVDGYNTGSAPGGAAAEVTLDIDLLAALAPNLSGIRVYENDDTGSVGFTQELVDTFTAMAHEPLATRPTVISVSYGESELFEAASDFDSLDQAAAQLASQGQSVCVSSGDAGAYTDQSTTGEKPNASFPADSPHVLCVGGTDLTDSIDGSNVVHYVSETSWADTTDKGRGPIGTGGGGGVSTYFSIPSYQVGAFSTSVNPQGSTTKRNLPDVSLYGDYDTGGYDIYFSDPNNGPGFYGYNGTSASSPLWASFLANVNQARLANGLPLIGLSNAPIYQAAEKNYAADFHDIADGSTNLYYHAVKGYDNSTGWGSFIGSKLLADLSASTAPAALKSLAFSPTTVPSGGKTTGTVTLTAAAPTGGAAVTISQNGTTVATVTVPAGSTSAPFTLTAPAVTATTTYTFSAAYAGKTATATLTVTAASSAALKSLAFNPTTVASGGKTIATVTLTAAAPTGGAAVTISQNGTTVATVTVPAGSTSASFTLTAPTVTATTSFTYTAAYSGKAVTATLTVSTAPMVTKFSPSSGPVGTTVVITGLNFTGATSVTFSGVSASFTVNSATQITATVPATAVTGKISIVTPNGTATPSVSFTVTSAAAPTISGFSPTSGPVGATTTLTGTNLSGVTKITFHGTTATAFTVNSSTSVTAEVPAGATSGTISVTTPGGTATSTASFTVTQSGAVLSALSFNPSPGYSNGTTTGTVTLTAVAPTGGAAVTISQVMGTGSTVLGTITVPAGSVSASFTLGLPAVTATQTLTFSAAYAGKTVTTNLTVDTTTVAVSGFSVGPNPATSGATLTGSVILSAPAPAGGANVTITQNGVALGTVTILAGNTSDTFTFTGPTVSAATTFTYEAAYNNSFQNTNETVNP